MEASVLNTYVAIKEERGKEFHLKQWGDYLNLEARLREVSKKTYDEVHQAHRLLFWGTAHRLRWLKMTRGEYVLNAYEAALFCKVLNCSIEELLDPNFSFADREAELRRQQEEEEASRYGLSLPQRDAA